MECGRWPPCAAAARIDFGGHVLVVADLADIIKSKRAAGRPRDRAVLEILEKGAEKKKERERCQGGGLGSGKAPGFSALDPVGFGKAPRKGDPLPGEKGP